LEPEEIPDGITSAAAIPSQTDVQTQAIARITPSTINMPAIPTGMIRPTTDIYGIDPARAQRLAEASIDSLGKLSTARPEAVARVLRGVPVETARPYVEEANSLVAVTG
jgi:hypothetical protein